MKTPIQRKINIPYYSINTKAKDYKNFYGTLGFFGDLHGENSYFDDWLFNEQITDICDNEQNPYIFITGDTGDYINHKDPRFVEDMRNERFKKYLKRQQGSKFVRQEYMNALVDYFFDLLKPYAEHIYIYLRGNHSFNKFCAGDIDLFVVDKLNEYLKNKNSKHQIFYGGTSCFFKVIVLQPKLKTQLNSISGYIEHGNSNAIVTRGLLESARKVGVYNCDILAHGHSHAKYNVSMESINFGKESTFIKEVRAIRTGSFMNYGGYAREKNLSPRATGAMLQRFMFASRREKITKYWID